MRHSSYPQRAALRACGRCRTSCTSACPRRS
ncbi:MAG: six-cysteine peptide SCIFF, partial [Proteobacteria bacterium]|nr:six-cysteine peptide SCIFF [Pseudomonadota bacterium]